MLSCILLLGLPVLVWAAYPIVPLLLSIGADNATSGNVWDIGKPVTAIAISPDGQLVAVGRGDGVIELRRLADGALVRNLTGQWGEIRVLSFNHDGTVLASSWGEESKLNYLSSPPVNGDIDIRLWQVSDGRLLRTLPGQPFGARTLEFSPDDRVIAAGGKDAQVQLWAADNGTLLKALPARPVHYSSWTDVIGLSFSPAGELSVAYGDNTVQRWQISTQVPELEWEETPDTKTWGDYALSDFVRTIALSHDSTKIANSTYNDVIFVRSIPDEELLHPLGTWDSETGWHGHEDLICALAFSPNDQMLASGGCDEDRDGSRIRFPDRSVRIWSVASGTEIHMFPGHRDSVRSLAWTPDGTLVVSGGDDGMVRLWQVK